MRLDYIDAIALIGLLMVGIAIYLWIGLPATFLYTGIVMVTFSVVLALRRGDS